MAIALLGLILRGAVSANFLPLARNPETILSGGVLQAFSGSELIEVSTGLIIAVSPCSTCATTGRPTGTAGMILVNYLVAAAVFCVGLYTVLAAGT